MLKMVMVLMKTLGMLEWILSRAARRSFSNCSGVHRLQSQMSLAPGKWCVGV